jgi:hypothetical protein
MNIDWDGKGLPPVGAECEFWLSTDNWQFATCVALDTLDGVPVAVVRYDGGYYGASAKTLGPISKERKAELQREKDAEELAFIATGHRDRSKDCWLSVAKVLLDAGYRKFEIVEDDV